MVFRKNDGKQVGIIPSSGNANTIKTYTIIDQHIDFTLSNYSYELWQTDIDGRTAKIGETAVSIAQKEPLSISCYPNPTRDILNVEIPENNEITEMVLIDALGKEVFYEKIEKNHNSLIQINIKQLNPGIYTLRINEFGHKVIKQ